VDHEISVKDSARRIAERARDQLMQICQAREAVIIRGAVAPDQIHVVSTPPDMGAGQVAYRALSRLSAGSPLGGFSRNPDSQSELNSTGLSR